MKLGFLVTDLGSGQMNYLLFSQLNQLVADRPDLDVVVFYENFDKLCIHVNFAVMQMSEAFLFNGPLWATTFSTAQKLAGFPSCPRKFFYCWDMEWMGGDKPYEELVKVYKYSGLRLISRGKDHAAAIEQCWGILPPVIEDFNMEEILNESFSEKRAGS